MNSEINELVQAIRQDHERMRDDIAETRAALKELASTVNDFVTHVAIQEEQRKNDAEFKKEVREFIKESGPFIQYVKDSKAFWQKWRIAVGVAVTFAIAGLLGFKFK